MDPQSTKDAIARAVGRRMQARREALGLTRQDLAARLALTPDDIEAYETGACRLTAARLHQLALTLDTPIAALFGVG